MKSLHQNYGNPDWFVYIMSKKRGSRERLDKVHAGLMFESLNFIFRLLHPAAQMFYATQFNFSLYIRQSFNNVL